jgi:hypothetical protein
MGALAIVTVDLNVKVNGSASRGYPAGSFTFTFRSTVTWG